MDLKDVLFESNNEFEIPNLLLDRQAGKLELPFVDYSSARRRLNVATVHFYVDDYRFDNIWKSPAKILTENISAATEPNTSTSHTMPIAYGLQQIYKKRWIARYWQENGLLIYADLNVSPKFYEYNRMGIPKGYNAFTTRGSYDMLHNLEAELEIAKEISGLQMPNLIVYGGGVTIKKFCMENSLLYVEQYMTERKNHIKWVTEAAV